MHLVAKLSQLNMFKYFRHTWVKNEIRLKWINLSFNSRPKVLTSQCGRANLNSYVKNFQLCKIFNLKNIYPINNLKNFIFNIYVQRSSERLCVCPQKERALASTLIENTGLPCQPETTGLTARLS